MTAAERVPSRKTRPGDAAFSVRPTRALLVWAAVFGIVVAAAVASSGSTTDVVAGAVVVGLNTLLMIWVTRRMKQARLEFAGWSVMFRPPIGQERHFDARDVVAIRRRRNRAGVGYRIRLRDREAGHRHAQVYVNMSLFGTPQTYDELLSRIAAVPEVEADRKTAESLDAWRRSASRPTA